MGLRDTTATTVHLSADRGAIGTSSSQATRAVCQAPSPTEEDLLVFYVSEDQLQAAATSLGEAGFGLIRHENPYWANAGAVICMTPTDSCRSLPAFRLS